MTDFEDDTATPEETSDRALPGTRYRVVMVADDTGPFAGKPDGFEVRVSNRDLLAWDLTAPRKKWGTPSEVPFLFRSFVTWQAARREGYVTEGFETFQRTCDVIEEVDSDETAHPSRSGAGDGRS